MKGTIILKRYETRTVRVWLFFLAVDNDHCLTVLLRARAVPAGTAERVSAMVILSVCLSRPGTE